MRSTDMFLSGESRKKPENSVRIPEEKIPKGEVLSPYVISLWENQSLPNGAPSSAEKISPPQKEHEQEKTSSCSSENSDFTLHSLPETLSRVPSREDQIAKVKKAMSQFEELSKLSSSSRSRSENSGFFRNLKNLI